MAALKDELNRMYREVAANAPGHLRLSHSVSDGLSSTGHFSSSGVKRPSGSENDSLSARGLLASESPVRRRRLELRRVPAGQLDAVIILNSYHEMPRYEEILLHIRESLKPGGRLVIAEPGPPPAEQTRAAQIARHHIGAQFVADEVSQAGFAILEHRERFAQIPDANWYSLVVGQRPASEEVWAAEMKRRVIANLHLRSGAEAADVGFGDGFYTLPMAVAVGALGKVFAVDIDEKRLSKLRQRLTDEGLRNIRNGPRRGGRSTFATGAAGRRADGECLSRNAGARGDVERHPRRAEAGRNPGAG